MLVSRVHETLANHRLRSLYSSALSLLASHEKRMNLFDR